MIPTNIANNYPSVSTIEESANSSDRSSELAWFNNKYANILTLQSHELHLHPNSDCIAFPADLLSDLDKVKYSVCVTDVTVKGRVYVSLSNRLIFTKLLHYFANTASTITIDFSEPDSPLTILPSSWPRGVLMPMAVRCHVLSLIIIKGVEVKLGDIESMRPAWCPALAVIRLEDCSMTDAAAKAIPFILNQLLFFWSKTKESSHLLNFNRFSLNHSHMAYHDLGHLDPALQLKVLRLASTVERLCMIQAMKSYFAQQVARYNLDQIIEVMCNAKESKCPSLVSDCLAAINSRYASLSIDFNKGRKHIALSDATLPELDKIMKPIAHEVETLTFLGPSWKPQIILDKLKGLNSLSEVTFKHCDELTDQTLSEIAQTHFSLSAIKIFECPQITSGGIDQIDSILSFTSSLPTAFSAVTLVPQEKQGI